MENFRQLNENELIELDGNGALSSFAGSAAAYSAAVAAAAAGGPLVVVGAGVIGASILGLNGMRKAFE